MEQIRCLETNYVNVYMSLQLRFIVWSWKQSVNIQQRHCEVTVHRMRPCSQPFSHTPFPNTEQSKLLPSSKKKTYSLRDFEPLCFCEWCERNCISSINITKMRISTAAVLENAYFYINLYQFKICPIGKPRKKIMEGNVDTISKDQF